MSTFMGSYVDFDYFIGTIKDLAINEYILWTVPQEMEILDAEERVREKLSDSGFIVSSSFSKGTVKVEKIN